MSPSITTPPPAKREPYQVKCSVLRGYAAVLTRTGQLDAVMAQLTPLAQSQVREPPASSAWMDPRAVDEITNAVFAQGGNAAVRKLAREGLSQGVLPVIRPLLEGLLRVFGASPATLYRRLDTVSGTTMRGVHFVYTAATERSGSVEAEIYDPVLQLARYQRFIAAFEILAELCRERVVVADPVVLAQGASGSRARFDVRW